MRKHTLCCSLDRGAFSVYFFTIYTPNRQLMMLWQGKQKLSYMVSRSRLNLLKNSRTMCLWPQNFWKTFCGHLVPTASFVRHYFQRFVSTVRPKSLLLPVLVLKSAISGNGEVSSLLGHNTQIDRSSWFFEFLFGDFSWSSAPKKSKM